MAVRRFLFLPAHRNLHLLHFKGNSRTVYLHPSRHFSSTTSPLDFRSQLSGSVLSTRKFVPFVFVSDLRRLASLSGRGLTQKAEEQYSHMLKYDFQHTHLSWAILMDAYAQAHDFEGVGNVLKRMEHEGSGMDELHLLVLAKCEIMKTQPPFKEPKDCANLLVSRIMEILKAVEMDELKIACLIVYCDPSISRRVMEELLRKFDLIPSTLSYNALLKTFAECGDQEGAEEILDEMKLKCTPNRQTQSILLQLHANAFDYSKAVEIANSLKSIQLEEFNFVIKSVRNIGDIDEAMFLLQHLKSANLQPDADTFLGLLQMIFRQNNLSGCLKLIQMTESERISPNDALHSFLITFYAHLKDTEKLLAHYQALLETDIAPDLDIFKTMSTACLDVRDPKLLEMILTEMEKFEVQPDLEMYRRLLLCCEIAYDVDLFVKLYRELLSREIVVTFECSMDLVSSLGKWRTWKLMHAVVIVFRSCTNFSDVQKKDVFGVFVEFFLVKHDKRLLKKNLVILHESGVDVRDFSGSGRKYSDLWKVLLWKRYGKYGKRVSGANKNVVKVSQGFSSSD